MRLEPWPYPLWWAHRGAGKQAPENTLAAFREGARWGFDAFECDVKLSADGVPYLLHDATLERTTSGCGPAGMRSWSELAVLDAGAWHGGAFAGEPLPRLSDVAAHCRAQGHALNIEIKPVPGAERDTGRVVAQQAAALWRGDVRAPLLSSFQVPALEAAAEAAPGLPRALLLEALWVGWFATALDLDAVAVVAHHPLWTADLVAQVHGAGLRAMAYTANDSDDVARLLGLGVDGLITDAVDRYGPASPSAPAPASPGVA